MLSELLPGLRELRSALAAGYLWLIFAWLLFHAEVDDAGGPLGDLVDLGGDVSDIGLATAASFAAYLVGSLSEDIFVRWFLRLMERRGTLAQEYGAQAADEVERINDPDLVREELARLDNDADRAESEARLRVALLPPTAAIFTYLAIEHDPSWALGWIGVVALGAQAWVRVVDSFSANMKLSAFRSEHNLVQRAGLGSSSA